MIQPENKLKKKMFYSLESAEVKRNKKKKFCLLIDEQLHKN